ncbi:MAG TPA: 5'-nucleotidase C-terminal domain-containing protein [Flavihumibacter sp.]|jgi:2',3'-cyclic-nucleotide 2'-phosphodiesterase (5'-nucleotidase family)
MSMFSFANIRTVGLLTLLALAGCARSYQPSRVEYEKVRITAQSPRDPQLESLLKPYADSVNLSMNKVIGEVERTLEKKMPEGTLNNLLADAMLAGARTVFGDRVQLAFVNYGGVRSLQLPAGPLTIGRVFELMPFENILVIQEVPGAVLQQFLNKMAERGGWPSAGVQYTIKDKKAINVLINGKPLDPAATYVVANSDYIANGGDDCHMLRDIPQINKGVLVRDVFLQYFESLSARGIKINAQLENRIVNAD